MRWRGKRVIGEECWIVSRMQNNPCHGERGRVCINTSNQHPDFTNIRQNAARTAVSGGKDSPTFPHLSVTSRLTENRGPLDLEREQGHCYPPARRWGVNEAAFRLADNRSFFNVRRSYGT